MTKLSKNTYNHEKKTAGYYAGRVLTVISWFIAFCTASSGIIILFHGADDGSLSIQGRVIYFVICVIIIAALICLGNWGRRISKKNVTAKKTPPKEPVVEASAIGSEVQVQTEIVLYNREDLGLSADKKQYQPVKFFDPDRKSDIHTAEPSLKDVFMEISASSPYRKDMLKHVKFSENYITSDYCIISHYRPEYKRPSIVIIGKDQYEVKLGPDDDMRGPAGLKRFTDIREAMRYFVKGLDNNCQWDERKKQMVRDDLSALRERIISSLDGRDRYYVQLPMSPAEVAAWTGDYQIKYYAFFDLNLKTREVSVLFTEYGTMFGPTREYRIYPTLEEINSHVKIPLKTQADLDKLFDDRLKKAITERRSVDEENARRKNELDHQKYAIRIPHSLQGQKPSMELTKFHLSDNDIVTTYATLTFCDSGYHLKYYFSGKPHERMLSNEEVVWVEDRLKAVLADNDLSVRGKKYHKNWQEYEVTMDLLVETKRGVLKDDKNAPDFVKYHNFLNELCLLAMYGSMSEKEASKIRIDLLKKPYCTRQRDKELYYVLVSDKVPYDETCIKMDIRNGKLYKVHDHIDMHFVSHETCTPIDADELKRFVADFPTKIREKFGAFTDENWKSFVPKTESKDLSDERPETLKLSQSTLSSGIIIYPDFDAFYVRIERHLGSDMAFLRKTTSGWRAFSRSPGYFTPEECTEENIANIINNTSPGNQYLSCFDQLLSSSLALQYIMSVMPPYCPEKRPSGQLRRSTPISMYKDDVTIACYYKNGKWIPCADFENIVEIKERLSNVAKYSGLTFTP